MGYQPSPGHPVALISPDGAELLGSGVIAGSEGIVIHVECDGKSAPVPHGDLLVVTGTPGAGHMGYASVVAVSGTSVTLALLLEFRDVLDRRRSRRVPACIPITVRLAGGDEVPGRLLDLSGGGAAVQPDTWEPGFELGSMVFQWDGARVELSASVTASEDSWQGILLHCRFIDSDEDRPQLIDGILAELTREHDQAQQLLAAGQTPAGGAF